MPDRLVAVMASLCLLLSAGFVSGESAAEDSLLTTDAFQTLSAEFKSLRNIKGQFDGGSWQDDVDRWMGRKHRVMTALARYIDKRGLSRNQLNESMGPPDRVLTPGDPFFKTIVRTSPFTPPPSCHSCELLMYRWRGDHDLLYFIAAGDHLLHSGWWHAGE